jgi:hypothetical protein
MEWKGGDTLNAKLREIHDSCRDLVDKIGLITTGRMQEDLKFHYKTLRNFCEEAIQEIEASTGKRKTGEHQHHPELQAIADGRFIPSFF